VRHPGDALRSRCLADRNNFWRLPEKIVIGLIWRASRGPELRAEPLLSLAATVSGQHHTEEVLDSIVRGLAEQPDVALARVWLLKPSDICPECQMRKVCADQTRCLHLAASAGSSLSSPAEDWNSLNHPDNRIPLSNALEGHIASKGVEILQRGLQDSTPGIIRPSWLANEKILSFAGHPLVSGGEIVGVLAIFSRGMLNEMDSAWLQIFAQLVAVAITNARAFDERQRAAEIAERHAAELRQVIDVAPMQMFVWEADGSASFGNRAAKDYFRVEKQLNPLKFLELVTHPDDIKDFKIRLLEARNNEEPFDYEARMRRHDGEYRWFRYQSYPLRHADGTIARWCGIRTDIHDQKMAEERAAQETIALREEIDKASMFEEIVGASPALQAALTRVSRVAATNSTVLITGETGTGKELIARAIHKRSPRASRAFIGVNCAAIPRDLIPSELFGHEKGAFTGALQRRIGRFELADGGTIFLDEMGELPIDTQIALLRVLQEREFERVGGSQSIRVDTRVVAATNRDLQASVDAGTFRSDLLYRINVFPIHVPPLRERKEDIPLLVEYFVDRFSTSMGKRMTKINKKSLALLEAYPWPGNIRELQNVVERSVIVCDGDEFSVDESWISHTAAPSRPLNDSMATQEKESIEAALAQSKGRVSGPTGAAAKLGVPPSTLDSKIRALKIDKRKFQSS
jgi:PAS domain S-box-containing protein